MRRTIPVLNILFTIGLGVIYNYSYGQSLHDEMMCPGKTTKQLAKEKNKKKTVAGVSKALVCLSYLNYSDRTVDRVFSGMDEFEAYRGSRIRKIEVRVLEPFGVSIEKPVTDHYTKFQKFADKIQFRTREWTVRNELLFKQGEKVDPMTFADTERNLWDRGTFKDLKIFITPVDGSDDDEVDVVVMVQDRWSWSLISGVQYNQAQVGVAFQNLAGMPMSVSQKVAFNYRKDNPYTVSGGFEYDNIKRSHIDISTGYTYEDLSRGAELTVNRRFFSANSKWAGRLDGGVNRQFASVPNSLEAAIPTNVMYNWEDAWLAESFKFPAGLGDKTDLMRLIVSARAYRMDYMMRPYKISPDGSQLFVDHSFYLGSIGFANWNYYVDHSVYSLGNAEYFSKGFNAALMGGLDDDEEYGRRFYSGVQMNYGKYIKNFGYVNTVASYSGFWNGKIYDQVLAKLNPNYFSAPVNLGRSFMLRQFISADINMGFNRPSDRELAINNYNGVRGIFLNYIRGNRTYVFNFETDLYSKFKVLGFSSSVFAFADIAVVQQNSYTSHQLCEGYGAGIRLRNKSLGIDYFEFSVVYYPALNIPGNKPYSLMANTSTSRGMPGQNLFIPTILAPDQY